MPTVDDFLRAALVPRRGSHVSGTLDEAESLRAALGGAAGESIHAAAVLGDEATVRRLLAEDTGAATRPGGPYSWDPLTHLCFSRYLRLDAARGQAFVRTATLLLDAGADPNGGWFEESHQPEPCWESVLYGAAGVAHHPGLTRLLLERGADPNDGETPYHAPEGRDLETIQAVVGSGRLNDESVAMLLGRMVDWHHLEGLRWVLAQGVDPTPVAPWGRSALQHAILRDNDLAIIELLLDHGAVSDGTGPDEATIELAVRGGRGDVLDAWERRGMAVEVRGAGRILEACARGDAAEARRRADEDPEGWNAVLAEGAECLGRYAGTGNAEGVRALLDVGVPVDVRWLHGDGYYGIAPFSTALHAAAWRMGHEAAAVLVERGADVNARDGRGRTPLMLAVSACVDSYWSRYRSPEGVRMLLEAGASRDGVRVPSGYDEVDALLA